MTVAVVGSGISGLAAAYFLSRRHTVSLYEKNQRLGGHTNTVVVDDPAGRLPLDTGFLVHNDRTYPNLVRLFREIGVRTRDSDMSFSVSCRRTGLEYSSRGASGFFAQRQNLFRGSHLRLLRDIVRFNREAPTILAATDAAAQTLGDFLDARGFGDDFAGAYLFPMASAIWSASLDAIRAFPALTLIRFFENHGLLSVNGHPAWKVVDGGSHSYIPRLTAPVSGGIHCGANIQAIRRRGDGVAVTFTDNRPAQTYDAVVMACHGDEVLPLLADASDRERDVFSSFETTANEAWLHTDPSMLPIEPRARASWNYRLSADPAAPPTVTYDLNRLQGLTTSTQYAVTLNPGDSIRDRRVLRRLSYTHPLYTRAAIRAQARWAEVNGAGGIHYCGAYWSYGFHEDGLTSAIRVARALGVEW
jgi:predicted NAD/FAD-binding protein